MNLLNNPAFVACAITCIALSGNLVLLWAYFAAAAGLWASLASAVIAGAIMWWVVRERVANLAHPKLPPAVGPAA